MGIVQNEIPDTQTNSLVPVQYSHCTLHYLLQYYVGQLFKIETRYILLLQTKLYEFVVLAHLGFLDHSDPLLYRTKMLKDHDIHDLKTSLFMLC